MLPPPAAPAGETPPPPPAAVEDVEDLPPGCAECTPLNGIVAGLPYKRSNFMKFFLHVMLV